MREWKDIIDIHIGVDDRGMKHIIQRIIFSVVLNKTIGGNRAICPVKDVEKRCFCLNNDNGKVWYHNKTIT